MANYRELLQELDNKIQQRAKEKGINVLNLNMSMNQGKIMWEYYNLTQSCNRLISELGMKAPDEELIATYCLNLMEHHLDMLLLSGLKLKAMGIQEISEDIYYPKQIQHQDIKETMFNLYKGLQKIGEAIDMNLNGNPAKDEYSPVDRVLYNRKMREATVIFYNNLFRLGFDYTKLKDTINKY